MVDSKRNAVSFTTTINTAFGSKILSPSTGEDLYIDSVQLSTISCQSFTKCSSLKHMASEALRMSILLLCTLLWCAYSAAAKKVAGHAQASS